MAQHERLEIPTEMEALGDKRAVTLATSFERLLRTKMMLLLGLLRITRLPTLILVHWLGFVVILFHCLANMVPNFQESRV